MKRRIMKGNKDNNMKKAICDEKELMWWSSSLLNKDIIFLGIKKPF